MDYNYPANLAYKYVDHNVQSSKNKLQVTSIFPSVSATNIENMNLETEAGGAIGALKRVTKSLFFELNETKSYY